MRLGRPMRALPLPVMPFNIYPAQQQTTMTHIIPAHKTGGSNVAITGYPVVGVFAQRNVVPHEVINGR